MKAWSWISYPAVVVVVILASMTMLFGNLGLWDKFTARQSQLQKNVEIEAQLRTKLAKLQAADLVTERQNLDYLIQVLPANKNISVLLAQIGQAASASGAIFEGFRGQIGEISATSSDALELEVTLQITDMYQLQQTLAILETSLPLVEVNQVKMAMGKAILTVEGAWSLLAKLPSGAQYEVPDISNSLTQIRSQLGNYTTLSQVETSLDAGVNLAPFQ